MSAAFRLQRIDGNRIVVQSPFLYADGDGVGMYLEAGVDDLVRITDLGETIGKLLETMPADGRGAIRFGDRLRAIVASHGLVEIDGEIFVSVTRAELGPAVVRFGQALCLIATS